MNYENYTSDQKELAHTIVRKVEHSGCTTDECVQVLSDMVGFLLAYMAQSKAELTEYLDNKLIPYIRRTALDTYGLKHQND